MDGRRLIVNADDFGQSPGVNRGVIESHERGIVNSASLMVRWPAAAAAAAYARAHPTLDVGLHVDLGEWVYERSTWRPRYEVVPLQDDAAVGAELRGQLAAFADLLGHPPSHIDSHQHVHHREPLRSILLNVAAALGIPLRGATPPIHYCGAFYGQTAEGAALPGVLTLEGLVDILGRLPAGTTELGCHPGFADDLDTTYAAERATEVEVLCDPRLRAALAHLQIIRCSFADATMVL